MIKLIKVSQFPGSDWSVKPVGLSSIELDYSEEHLLLSGQAIAYLNPKPEWGEECYVYWKGVWKHLYSNEEVEAFRKSCSAV